MRLEVVSWNANEPLSESTLEQRLESEGYDVFRWRDEAGAAYEPHSHARDQTLWVVAGEMVIGAAGREFRLGPGDRLMLPKGTVHSAHPGGAGVSYLIGERR